jgi:hypothetical protein
MGFAPRQCVLDGRLPLEIGQLIGHAVQINPANNAAALQQIQPFVKRTDAASDRWWFVVGGEPVSALLLFFGDEFGPLAAFLVDAVLLRRLR